MAVFFFLVRLDLVEFQKWIRNAQIHITNNIYVVEFKVWRCSIKVDENARQILNSPLFYYFNLQIAEVISDTFHHAMFALTTFSDDLTSINI